MWLNEGKRCEVRLIKYKYLAVEDIVMDGRRRWKLRKLRLTYPAKVVTEKSSYFPWKI